MRKAALLLVSVSALALCGPTPVKPDFGLRVGNAWTYSQKSPHGESTFKESAVRFVDVGKSKALEIKAVYSGGYEGYRYLGQDENGLLSYFNSQMRGPGVAADVKPLLLARMPFNKGLTWKYINPWRGQTSGDVTAEDLRKLDVHESAVIVHEAEPITVPAGTYNAIHVKVTSESEGRGRWFSDYWYVFGVGLVKSVIQTEDGTHEQVLTEFVPGQ
jgi:hypothetical protein